MCCVGLPELPPSTGYGLDYDSRGEVGMSIASADHRSTGAPSSAPAADVGASRVLGALRRRAFAPLFILMAILISLVATPVLTSASLRAHRRLISEVLDPARVALNDLEAA